MFTDTEQTLEEASAETSALTLTTATPSYLLSPRKTAPTLMALAATFRSVSAKSFSSLLIPEVLPMLTDTEEELMADHRFVTTVRLNYKQLLAAFFVVASAARSIAFSAIEKALLDTPFGSEYREHLVGTRLLGLFENKASFYHFLQATFHLLLEPAIVGDSYRYLIETFAQVLQPSLTPWAIAMGEMMLAPPKDPFSGF